MVSVELEDVTKRYGDLSAVEDLSLQVDDEEFVTILGPSGSGKTTILRLVAGLEDPSSGEIFFDGEEMTGVHPRDRNVSLVFQNLALFPHMSARENIAFPLDGRGLSSSEISSRVEEIADLLRISPLLEKEPGALSGGEQQRVALARAIVPNPRVLLLDEPLTGLEANFRLEMRTELIRLHRELDTTVIHVTHDQMEAMTMSDRIALIREGRLVQVGTPDGLYSRPDNRWAAEFVGSPPINVFDATVREDESSLEIDLGFLKQAVSLDKLPGKLKSEGEVALGVRPQDVRIATAPEVLYEIFEGTEEDLAEVNVFHLERTGEQTVVDMEVDDTVIKGIAPPDTDLEVGKDAFVALRGRVYLFDRTTGESLLE